MQETKMSHSSALCVYKPALYQSSARMRRSIDWSCAHALTISGL